MAKRKDSERSTLTVKDFGPIAEATVELRPFTVFVGASNTGKSYLAILLYALHRFFRMRSLRALDADATRSPAQLETIRRWLKQVPEAGRSKHSVDVRLPEHIAAPVRPVIEDVENAALALDTQVARCFGVAKAQSLIRSSGKSARIVLHRELDKTSADGPDLSYHFTITRSQPQLTATIPPNMPLRVRGPMNLYDDAVLSADLAFSHGSDSRHYLLALANLIVSYAVGTIARPIHYLPADRSGVMHTHRVAVRSLINHAALAALDVEPALSGVLADFLEQLIHLGDAEYVQSKAGTGRYAEHAERLETDILGGAVRIHESVLGYPSFHYRPAEWKRDLPLLNTSSMVSELAPVVLYLRHVVRPGDVLIIEEPESHLHPAMQVTFTRLLAAVVRSGVRVVLTTHSEWVLEALANLVRLSDVDESRRQEIAGDDLALTPDQVGAWLFEQKQRPKGSVVKEIPLDVRRGTFPAGFSEITEQLYNDWAGITNLVAERGE